MAPPVHDTTASDQSYPHSHKDQSDHSTASCYADNGIPGESFWRSCGFDINHFFCKGQHEELSDQVYKKQQKQQQPHTCVLEIVEIVVIISPTWINTTLIFFGIINLYISSVTYYIIIHVRTRLDVFNFNDEQVWVPAEDISIALGILIRHIISRQLNHDPVRAPQLLERNLSLIQLLQQNI